MFSERTNWKLAQNGFTQALEEVRAGGAEILDLTISNPTRAGLRYDELVITQPRPRGIRNRQIKNLRPAGAHFFQRLRKPVLCQFPVGPFRKHQWNSTWDSTTKGGR